MPWNRTGGDAGKGRGNIWGIGKIWDGLHQIVVYLLWSEVTEIKESVRLPWVVQERERSVTRVKVD